VTKHERELVEKDIQRAYARGRGDALDAACALVEKWDRGEANLRMAYLLAEIRMLLPPTAKAGETCAKCGKPTGGVERDGSALCWC
jgi:hypothetical protein